MNNIIIFIQRALNKIDLSRYLKLTGRVKIGNKYISAPIIGGVCLTNTEEWFVDALTIFLQARPGLFIDAGVNLGQTLAKVKCIDPSRRYLGFEVNLTCASYAAELIDINNFTEATILPVGLADKFGSVTLLSNELTDSSASIVSEFRDSPYKFQKLALAVPGDEILASLPRQPVGVIKIDVEGAELEVLLGFRRTLTEFQPIVTCEILPIYDPDTHLGRFRKERHGQVLDFLKGLGYRCFRMHHDLSFDPVCDVQIHSDLALCDYVFLPSDIPDSLLGKID